MDPCNPAGAEDFAGGPNGLDNDGDLVYDLADTDCQLLSPAPSPLNFGSVSTESSSYGTVTIQNGFKVGITVSNISLGGTDAGDFSLDVGDGSGGTCGSISPPIDAGSSCTVSVTFSPTAEGARTASLQITSDGGNPSVALSGTGTEDTVGVGQGAGPSVNLLLLGN